MRGPTLVPMAALLVGCLGDAYKPRAIHDTTGSGGLRFQCWDSDRDCQTDAVHRCGSYKGRPRGIEILDRRELVDAHGRKLIVLDVQCTP